MNVDKEIESLCAIRNQIAEYDEQIANRELDARLLRNRIEDEYRAGKREPMCTSQAAAEKAAKADPEYVAHERETATRTRQRATLAALAESKRLLIDKDIALLQTVGA